MVTIVIAYKPGNWPIFEVALSNIHWRTQADYEIMVVMGEDDEPDFNLEDCNPCVSLFKYPVENKGGSGAMAHGELLDHAVGDVDTHYMLTLDSDCFPVSDDWLVKLVGEMIQGAEVAGIVHPWPLPKKVREDTIEHKIRSKWNYRHTHVACQMVRTEFVRGNGLSFIGGGDTGLSIPAFAHEKKLKVAGLMPTCCAWSDGDIDPEFNRECCVIFGDAVYHHGAGSRETFCDVYPACHFGEARSRVIYKRSAAWILEDGHRYRFDREEEVAQHKMKRMVPQMVEYLKHNPRLFDD